MCLPVQLSSRGYPASCLCFSRLSHHVFVSELVGCRPTHLGCIAAVAALLLCGHSEAAAHTFPECQIRTHRMCNFHWRLCPHGTGQPSLHSRHELCTARLCAALYKNIPQIRLRRAIFFLHFLKGIQSLWLLKTKLKSQKVCRLLQTAPQQHSGEIPIVSKLKKLC